DVGLNEWARAENTPIDVALSGEVDHLGDLVLIESLRDGFGIADIALDEYKPIRPRLLQQIADVREVPGVSQLIKRDELHRLIAIDGHPHQVGSNKPGRAGDENVMHMNSVSTKSLPSRGHNKRPYRACMQL